MAGFVSALAFGLSIWGLAWLESQGMTRGSSRQKSFDEAGASKPKCVVALSPGIAEIVLTLGGGRQLVGITDHTKHPPGVGDGRTRVGGFLSPSLEGIVSLKPDLVIMREAQKELARRLREVGIRVVTVGDASVDDVLESVEKVGAAMGLKRRAVAWTKNARERLEKVREAVRLNRRRDARPPSRRAPLAAGVGEARPQSGATIQTKEPKVLFVVGRSDSSLRSLYGAASRTLPHSLIRHARGINILSSARARYPVVSKESILSLQPDVILEVVVSPSTFSPDEVRRSWAELGAVAAVEKSRVHILTSDRWLIPGPRVLDAVEKLAKLLHPGLHLPQRQRKTSTPSPNPPTDVSRANPASPP